MPPHSRLSFDLEENRSLHLEVRCPGVPASSGQVREVSSDGVRARFPRTSAPKLPLGIDVGLRFLGNQLKQPVACDARVLARRDEEHHRVYVFRLLRPEEIVPVLLPQIQGIYNRRGAVRIRPRGRVPIIARLRSESGLELRASLHDISASGMSMRVSPSEEALLACSAEVDVAVALPARPPLELHLRASIRERHFAGKLVHLGLAFQPEGSHNFFAQEQAILQYVFASCAEMQGKLAPGPCWSHPAR